MACLAFYAALNFDTGALYCDYGQAAATRERKAAVLVAGHFDTSLDEIQMSGVPTTEGEIIGRNGLLVSAALIKFPRSTGLICLGIHAGTGYADCGGGFLDSIKGVVEECSAGLISVSAPFLTWAKSDIWEFARSRSLPIHETYSCERGLDQPCGGCKTCGDLEALYAR
jgi:7-cyano-7-deazaguanine synthase